MSMTSNVIPEPGETRFAVVGGSTFVLSLIGFAILAISQGWFMGLIGFLGILVAGWVLGVLLALFMDDRSSEGAPVMGLWGRLKHGTTAFFVGYVVTPLLILNVIGEGL